MSARVQFQGMIRESRQARENLLISLMIDMFFGYENEFIIDSLRPVCID